MATTTKALAIARELIDLWTKEVSTSFASVAESFDTNGNPVITLSDGGPSAGEKVAVVRISPIAWTATDILGNASQVYTPHVIDLCTEANNAVGAVADILTPTEILPILAEIVKRGTMVRWYVSPNATVPATTQMTSGNLSASYSDLYWSASKAQ